MTGPGPGPAARENASLITFLSDFGLADEFVGVVHAVLHRLAPAARVVDLTHGIARHDVRAGALTLWRAAPWVAPGVILAVVDPGVGTARRGVALQAGPAVLVGPDNGLLLPAAVRLGGVTDAVELPPAAAAPGQTFHGRDVFAPAAGALAAGAALGDVGRPVDPDTLVGTPLPEPGVDGPVVRAEVLWVDHFGNAQLNLTAADVDRLAPPAGAGLRLFTDPAAPASGGDGGRPVPVVTSYGDIGPGRLALVVDSYGMLSVCAERRSAAAELGLVRGSAVGLCREGPHPR